MYYSLTFSYDRPVNPLFFDKDDRTYPSTATHHITPKNTWIDWHLVPTERPAIATAELKTKTVEVSGMNGDLDLSESLTGYPLYSNRKGSIEFMIMNDYDSWHDIYQNICSYLHGRDFYMAYEEDPGYYYHGRFTVEPFESGDNNSHITISYNLEPYKYDYRIGRKDGGYWDIFDFETDNIDGVRFTNNFASIDVDSVDYISICTGREWGNYTERPFMLEFTLNDIPTGGFITIHFVNGELGIDVEKTFEYDGTYKVPEMMVSQNRNYGKLRYQISPTARDIDAPDAITYDDMGYGADSGMTLEAKGHGKISILAIPGRR